MQGYGNQIEQNIRINATSATLTNLTVSIEPDDFQITIPPLGFVARGDFTFMRVRPYTGMRAGTYRSTVFISSNGNPPIAAVSLSFTVNGPPATPTPTPSPTPGPSPTPTPAPTPSPMPAPTPHPYIPPEILDRIRFGERNWIVLDVQDDRVKLLHETVITGHPYHSTNTAVTWATSSSRAWLNGEFLNSFSEADRARIRETNVVNNDNPWYGTNGGENTTDRIFLLSIEEVVRYFGDSGQLQNRPSENTREINDNYNNARIARNAEGIASQWWLRSPGNVRTAAAYVGRRGGLLAVAGMGVTSWSLYEGGLRPALWLNL
jgi:hypothetical protein